MKLLILFTIITISAFYAQRANGFSCPQVQPLDDFDTQKFTGVWYIVAEHINKYTSHLNCLAVNLTSPDSATIHGYYEGIKKENGEHVRYHTVSKAGGDPKQGILNVVEVETYSDTDVVIHTLYVHYDQCSISYTCNEAKETLYSWTICRTRFPSPEAVREAHEAFDKYGIPWDDRDEVNQNNCPDELTFV